MPSIDAIIKQKTIKETHPEFFVPAKPKMTESQKDYYIKALWAMPIDRIAVKKNMA